MNKLVICTYTLMTCILLNIYCFSIFAETYTEDQYENDNNYTKASFFIVNSKQQMPQIHNFHNKGDVDWVLFYGFANRIYEISAFDLASHCDVVLELYDTDGKTMMLEKPVDTQATEQPEIITHYFDTQGLYHIKIYHYDMNIFGDNTEYKIDIRIKDGDMPADITGVITDAISGKRMPNVFVSTDKGREDYSSAGMSNGVFHEAFVGRYYIMDHEPGSTVLSASHQNYSVFSSVIDIREVETIRFDIQMIPDLLQDFSKNSRIDLEDALYALTKVTAESFKKKDTIFFNNSISLKDIIFILQLVCDKQPKYRL